MTEIKYATQYYEGYGAASQWVVSAIYKNRLLEKQTFGDSGSAGYGKAKLEAKWDNRADLDELLDTFPLASALCTKCGNDTLAGQTSICNEILCKNCAHLVPQIREEYQARQDAMEAERKSSSDAERVARLTDAEGGFHWQNGWFFKRRENGDVAVFRAENYTAGRDAFELLTIPENEWASIVCSVSALGESGERWNEARNFHGRK